MMEHVKNDSGQRTGIKEIHQAADSILHYCLMLTLTDEESIADDLDFYVPMIKSAAEEIQRRVIKL